MHILEIFPIILFFISYFGIIRTDNIVKTIVCLMMMQAAVTLFWLGVGSRAGVLPPILGDASYLERLESIANPLPQALMITAIVIGIAVTAVNITMFNTLYKKYHAREWADMETAYRDDPDIERVA